MMQFTVASEPSPGRPNEDLAVIGPGWAILLDGATAPEDIDSGCIHDVPWLVRHLGSELVRSLMSTPDMPLVDSLVDAISVTCTAHKATCDLDNPDSPSSTVAMLRQRGIHLDYLLLADSPLVLDLGGDGHPLLLVDDRTAHLSDYSFAGIRAARNKPGGFYVASTQPDAAYEAVRGTMPVDKIRRGALLSDGASRLVDLFDRITWTELLDVLQSGGPSELIARTREVERQGAMPTDGRRRKPHDDATAIFLTR